MMSFQEKYEEYKQRKEGKRFLIKIMIKKYMGKII